MRVIAGKVDNLGAALAGCPVICISRRRGVIPGTTPAEIGRYVVAETVTGSDGRFSIETDFEGPLLAVAWDPNNSNLRPLVLDPVEG